MVTDGDLPWLMVSFSDWWWLTVEHRWIMEDDWRWLTMTNNDRLWLTVTEDDWLWLMVTDCDSWWRTVTNGDWRWLTKTDGNYRWLTVTDGDWWWIMVTDGDWRWLTRTDCDRRWPKVTDGDCHLIGDGYTESSPYVLGRVSLERFIYSQTTLHFQSVTFSRYLFDLLPPIYRRD